MAHGTSRSKTIAFALAGALLLSLPFGVAAQEDRSFVGAHGAMTPGSYMRTTGDTTEQLDLWPDQSFHFTSDGQAHAGRWHADPRQGAVVLDLGTSSLAFDVRNAQRLRPVAAQGDASQDFELSDSFSPAALNLPISGMLTYFADAATIVHCATGKLYPVAQDEDYLTLERAYLADRAGPAEPLFVTMDAVIEMRAQMEGPERLTVVPMAFTGAFPGEDCRLGNRSLDLQDAVWRMTALGDTELDPSIGSREPFMSFSPSEDMFLASVGCNTIRGGMSGSGSDLSFAQPMSSTMMACPDPLAALEAQLGDILSSVARYEIGGRTLRLMDAEGDRVARFRAAYLPFFR